MKIKKIRNFTGKTIIILNENTGERKVLESEGKVTYGYEGGPADLIDDISVVAKRKLVIVGMPEKEEGTMYVVPLMMAATTDLLNRNDILVPPMEADETLEEIICTFLEKNTSFAGS